MVDDALTFLAVCRHGSFLAAGRELGVAASTVARRVSGLEKHLGTALLERSTRGLTLTEAGQLFREGAEAAELALDQAENQVRSWLQRPSGRLRVAAPSAMIRHTLAPVTVAYMQRFPEVQVELVGTDQDVVPDGTELHLAIRASRAAPPDHLIQRSLGRVSMVICASPEWRAANPCAHPDELVSHPCIVLGSSPSAARVRVQRGDEVRSLVARIGLFTTSISMARRAAVAGLGPVGLPAVSCADLLARGALVPVLDGWTLAPVPVVALYAGDRQLPLRVRAFLDALVAAFEDP